jgi:hypothetical protein
MYEPQDPRETGNEVNWSYTGAELAISLISAQEGEGRPTMIRRLEEAELGRPGAERAIRLLDLGREAFEWLADHGYRLSSNACIGEAEALPGQIDIQSLFPNVESAARK